METLRRFSVQEIIDKMMPDPNNSPEEQASLEQAVTDADRVVRAEVGAYPPELRHRARLLLEQGEDYIDYILAKNIEFDEVNEAERVLTLKISEAEATRRPTRTLMAQLDWKTTHRSMLEDNVWGKWNEFQDACLEFHDELAAYIEHNHAGGRIPSAP